MSPTRSEEGEAAPLTAPTDVQITAEAAKLGMSDLRPLIQQWDEVKALVRKFAAPPASTGSDEVLEKAARTIEIFNQRPRPMCRDCADLAGPDGICPNGGLPCDVHALVAALRSLRQQSQPAPQGEVRMLFTAPQMLELCPHNESLVQSIWMSGFQAAEEAHGIAALPAPPVGEKTP